MRPIKLSMTAFGPFIATETVDFEVFGERPLFLINGATGAGKTTILDAMCFALYGQTTGKEREAMQMRCDYADDNTTTSVEFTFELVGMQYRILRMPEQTRAKKSGEGTTTQKARAELWQLSKAGETVLVPEKVTEATQKIEDLTGLQVDQFRQVMVLPQGQFRRLLMADSKDREQIFSQLFETGIYKKIEDKLKQLASKVNASVETLKNEKRGVLQTVSFEDPLVLEAAISEKTPEQKAAATLKAKMESDYLAGLKAFNAGKLLNEDFEQLKLLNADFKGLEEQVASNETKEKRLNLVEQALKIRPAYTEKLRLNSDLKTLGEEAEAAKKTLQQTRDQLSKTTLALGSSKDLEKQKDELKQHADLLISYRKRASKLQLAEEALKQSEASHQKSVVSLDEEVKRLDQIDAQIKQSEVEKKSLEKSLTREVEVAAQTEKQQQIVAVRQRYEQLLSNKASQLKQFSAITEKGKQAKAHKELKEKELKQLDLAWHSGQAAILARQLQQDQPCLVCGSIEHPEPAQTTLEIPTEEQRELAQQSLEKAQAELLKVREEYSRLKSLLDSLEPQLADLLVDLGSYADQSLAQLKQQYQSLAAESRQMQSCRQQLESIDKKLEQSKLQKASAENQLKQIQKLFSESQLQLQSRKTELMTAQQELPNDYCQSGKLEKDILAAEASLIKLSKQIELAQQAHIDAGKQYSNAEASLKGLKARQQALSLSVKTSVKQWEKELAASVFSTADEFLKADLSAEEQSRLKEEVETFKSKLQILQGAIQERTKA